MKETDIRKYAELMKDLDLTGLEITEDNKVVRLERNLSISSSVVPTSAVNVPVMQTPENSTNEITAEADGVISEILVTNGQMVEYGTKLFRIRKDTP